MTPTIDRRQLFRLAGLGGVGIVFGSTLLGRASAQGLPGAADDFFFVQLSDLHWGFKGDAVNPDADGTLKKAIAAVNGLARQPDFVTFTGDLTHITDDPQERRRRMSEVRDIIGQLKPKQVRFLPGEHDAAKDNGEAYREFFGATHYTFDHKGVHFIALDNVSHPEQRIGEPQLKWLAADLAQLDPSTPIVVLTHRPLFDLYPAWDWYTIDGAEALKLLMPFKTVTVFFGHIHQEHHFRTGHIVHHAATTLMIPLVPPGSKPKREPIPWDAAHPYRGMGWREVALGDRGRRIDLSERPMTKS